MADNTSVAVLGTGIMGSAMARHLARAGLDVRAWNRTRAKAEPLAADGVRVTDTPGEAVDGAASCSRCCSTAPPCSTPCGRPSPGRPPARCGSR